MQPVSHEALREADQDVKLIVHSKSHFVALRQLEGEWQVNFGHKRHVWHDAVIATAPNGVGPFWRRDEKWHVDMSQVTAFAIVHNGEGCAAPRSDRIGSSESPAFPTFIDSEFSSTPDTPSSSSCNSLLQSSVLERIDGLNSFCSEYIALLASQPELFATLPSPFRLVQQGAWSTSLRERRSAFNLVLESSSQSDRLSTETLTRVFKRLRIYFSMCRQFVDLIQQNPSSLILPNPCDPCIGKREWERAAWNQRQAFQQNRNAEQVEWEQQQASPQSRDALGGSIVEVVSVLTGEHICSCDFEQNGDRSLADVVRNVASGVCQLPFFAIDVFCRDREESAAASPALLQEDLTWLDMGRPAEVQILKKHRVLEWTEDIFTAVDMRNADAVRWYLTQGQDPNCTFQQSILCCAVETGSLPVVQMLLKGQACPNFAPHSRNRPLHTAVLHDQGHVLSALLESGADPNLVNGNGDSPLHLAVLYGDLPMSCRLLSSGADALLLNSDSQSAFFCAGSGLLVTMCICHCVDRVTPVDLIARHLPIIVQQCSCRSLWPASKFFSRQQKFWDVVGGGVVTLQSALTGEEVLRLPISEVGTCQQIKRLLARFLGHPTFAISIFADGAEVCEESTWGSLGFPASLQVILKQRTATHTSALVHSILVGDSGGAKAALEAGQDPDCWVKITGRFSEPALSAAIAVRSAQCVSLLLEGLANPNAAGGDHRTALHLAALVAEPLVAKAVLMAQANVHAQDSFGQTPLHLAAMRSSADILQDLLEARANPLARDQDGETPLVVGFGTELGLDARCLLLNSCWPRLQALDIFQLILVELCDLVAIHKLRKLCRPLNCQAVFYFGHDICGGSGVDPRKRKVHTDVKHNKLIAKSLCERKKNDVHIAPQSTKLSMPEKTSLHDFNLQSLLPEVLGHGYVVRSIMPEKPCTWPTSSPEVIDHLRFLHAHPRDARLTFEPESHTYFWDSRRVSISTTGLLHNFTQGFDPDEAIAKMTSGRNWPRVGYLKHSIPDAVWLALSGLGYAKELLLLLSAKPRPEEQICELTRSLINQHPSDKDVLQSIAQSAAQIKVQWSERAEVGASQGTWMHTSFECLLNGGFITTFDEETSLFKKFLESLVASSAGIQVFRTEWAIFATEEDLAGSIDLALKTPDGCLVLVDWKRTKGLSLKFESFGRCMKACLSHVPDSTLWQYRLQLNIYRCILEKYYSCRISSMFIVGCNPDNGVSPFVEDVPFLQEAHALMTSRLQRPCDDFCAGGGLGCATLSDCPASPLQLCVLGLHLAGWKEQTPADTLFLHSLFGKPCNGPQAHARVWLQLDEFYKTAFPFSQTIAKFPALFWILPAPFETMEPRIEWRYKLEVARIFLRLIQDGQAIQLESGIIAFFWPEIQLDPSLLDIVSTARTSSSRRNRIKQLISALLCLHVLSLPSLHAQAKPMASNRLGPKRMPAFIFYRYLALYQALNAHVWEGRKGKAAKEKVLGMQFFPRHDRKGGASQEGADFEARVDAEMQHMDDDAEMQNAQLAGNDRGNDFAVSQAAPEAPAAIEGTQAKEEPVDAEDGLHYEVLVEDASEATWRILRKRRLLPGAATSEADFGNLFETLGAANAQFQAEPGEGIENPDTILHIVQSHETEIRRQHPRFSRHMVRLSTAALAIFCMRTADISMREHALMLWILEGTDFLRFHEGDCYMLHPSGAFQRYRGVPPDSSRVHNILLQLEGLFRRLPEDLPRERLPLLQAIRRQWEEAGESDETFAQRCVRAAVSNVGEHLTKHRGGEDELDVDSDVKHWRFHAARVVLQLKVRLARELTEDKLLHYMVEWCETPKKSAPACCFEDCCVEYRNDGVARQVARADIADVYVRIPHQLKGTVPPDILERVQKFYRQTFWCNVAAFKCCQAAQALAKRGHNVTRIFIGLSSGGVGQSLFSAHLQAGL